MCWFYIKHECKLRVPYTTLQNAFMSKYLPISRVTSILAKTLSHSRKIRAITIHVRSSRKTDGSRITLDSNLHSRMTFEQKIAFTFTQEDLITNHGLRISSIMLHGK